MELSKRATRILSEISDLCEENSFLVISDTKNSRFFIGSLDGDFRESFSLEKGSGNRDKFLSILMADRTILTRDDNASWMLDQYVLNNNLDGLVKPSTQLVKTANDIRYLLIPFIVDNFIDLWDTRRLRFNTPFENGKNLKEVFDRVAAEMNHLAAYYQAIKDKIVIKRETVYISGPITNNKNYTKDFKEAEELLQDRGFKTINPVYLAADLDGDPESLEFWQKAMDIDLVTLISRADELALIPPKGAHIPSKGVAIEKAVAADFRIDINPLSNYLTRRASRKEEQMIRGGRAI